MPRYQKKSRDKIWFGENFPKAGTQGGGPQPGRKLFLSQGGDQQERRRTAIYPSQPLVVKKGRWKHKISKKDKKKKTR